MARRQMRKLAAERFIRYNLDMQCLELDLTQGKVVLFDETDLTKILPYNWCAQYIKHVDNFYAVSADENRKRTYFHRVVLQAPKGMLVDHINHDGLDNRRCNIRLATPSQNQANRHKVVGQSKYHGVSWNTSENKWKVDLCKDGKSHFVGYFKDEIDAAKAYDAKALELFGEFARPNFPA